MTAISLQQTIGHGTAGVGGQYQPHHPSLCNGRLALHEDGTLECDHLSVPADDLRTQCCVNHSVAILLLELAARL